MQEYDVALKLLLQGSATVTMRALTGTTVAKWLDVELPKVQNLRLDLLGETVEGDLIHLELQSTNDPAMPLRMAEYALGVFRLFQKFPLQVVLYVGQAKMRMDDKLRGAEVSFAYHLIDIRTLDGEQLLESDAIGDNLIAILARLRDDRRAVHRVVRRIAGLNAAQRDAALSQLFILAGLRRLASVVEEESSKMPIETSILEHDVLGPLFLKGVQQGVQKGEVAVLRRQIQRRFGALPGWASDKLESLSTSSLEDLSERVLDATSVEELLG